jgi:hypothetical protein
VDIIAPNVDVEVRWRRAGDDAEAAACALEIFGMLTGLRQRPADAPAAYPRMTTSDPRAQSQAAEPISFVRASEQLAGVQWSDFDGGSFVLVSESGEIIEPRTRVRHEPSLRLGHVTRRRAMTVMLRPGEGGHRRRVLDDLDPLDGLGHFVSEFGEIVWWSVRGGASVGVLELNPDGNCVLCHRLSSEDTNETLLAQLKPNLALSKRHPETLIPRYALLAVNMSGVREVRPERAGPPPPSILERDDMLLLDKWIDEGWVEHIVWRDPDRIARDVLPGETLVKRWRENRVGLWLASYGRQLNYRTDKLQLRAMNMVSSEDRDNTVNRLQLARLNKGPLAGNGWGRMRFGFKRERGRAVVDPIQWPWVLRAFELADAGEHLDGRGLSTYRLAEALAAEDCPFDHDTLRRILANPIYATGEWTQNVRGIPVEQRPIQLEQPVPIDRFERIRNLLALRQGATKVTPLGEYLFNYVECVHKQCEGSLTKEGRVVLIKGRVDKRRPDGRRRYGHMSHCPPQCRSGGRGHTGSFIWERHELEKPVITKIRELVTHPELMRQATLAARHNVATNSTRLTEVQRRELEIEIERLQQQLGVVADEQVEKLVAGGNLDLETYDNLCGRIKRKIEAAQRRLDKDEAASVVEIGLDDEGVSNRVNAFLEVMTLEPPAEPALLQLRARIFQRIVSKIEIDDDGSGPITLTVHGHLTPEDAPPEFAHPVLAAADLLEAYESLKAGKTPAPDIEAARWGDAQTDLSEMKDKSVWASYSELLEMPGEAARLELKRSRIADRAWSQRRLHSALTGSPAWCALALNQL